MKKIILIAAAAVALCSCAKNKYVVEGNIEGLAGTVYMYNGQKIVDSTAVENGVFKFSGQIDTVGLRYLADTRGNAPATFSAMLILEPGTITVANDPAKPNEKKVTGTLSNDASNAYNESATVLITEFRNPETTAERREAIEKEYNQMTRTSMEDNRGNYFGATQLSQLNYELTGQETLDEIAKFSPELQQTEILVKLKENAENKIRTDVGQPYIDISLNNAEGQPVTLKSVIDNPANKYTLLDFWASWCGPCMGEVPVLVKTYSAFHAKGFEIYGVSFDRDRATWLAAIADNKMNWVHVCVQPEVENQAAKDYAVQGIPSNFLIDAQGKIVATNLRGEALYEKIASLLAE